MTDLRFAIRQLVRNPAFTIAGVFALALGIGANTAVFSVVKAVLLQPLPYENEDRLVHMFSTDPNGERDTFSIPEFGEFRERMRSMEDMAAFQSQSVNVTGGEHPDRVRGSFVSANFFKAFRLNPIIGRTLAEEEDKPGADKVVVVNEKLWRERLNADRDLTNKKLILNGEPYSVIGVIKSTFENPFDPDVEIWMSMANYPGNTGGWDSRFLILIGHLAKDVTLTGGQIEAVAIANQLSQAYPKENAGRGVKLDLYRNWVVGQVRPMLWLLFLAAGIIVLIACANLANLLLARGTLRQRELAIRAAVGASRPRLIRQLITEATLLALVGGGLGVLVAHWGLWGLLRLPQNFIQAEKPDIDGWVLFFAFGTSLLTGWLFGLMPALQMSRDAMANALNAGRSVGETARSNGIRSGFIVAQVAFSILLLIGAGLLIRSFNSLLDVNVGFGTKNLLTLEYRLPRTKYSAPASQWTFHQQVIERVRQLPGVESAALIRSLPFSGNGGSAAIVLPDRETPPAGHEPHVSHNVATPNYFATIGISLIQGRGFDERDHVGAPIVFIINQTMARRYWPNQDPIGKQIKMIEDGLVGVVIGVVGDTKQYWLSDAPVPQLYAVYSQQPVQFATLIARTKVEPLTLTEPVRQAIWSVDPDQPMWKIRTVEFLVQRSLANHRFLLALMIVFACLALVLTTIGLYGLISYLVSQRTKEIGIRMALGARVRHILQITLGKGIVLVSIGVIVGLIAAFSLTRLMAHLLFGVSATDPITFAGVPVILAIVALLACYFPARRAARVDPVVALRAE